MCLIFAVPRVTLESNFLLTVLKKKNKLHDIVSPLSLPARTVM